MACLTCGLSRLVICTVLLSSSAMAQGFFFAHAHLSRVHGADSDSGNVLAPAGDMEGLDLNLDRPFGASADRRGGYVLAGSPSLQVAQTENPDNESGLAANGDGSKGRKGEKHLGKAPPRQSFRQIFMRQSLVLLEPGDVQLEFTPEYLRDQFFDTRTRAASLISTLRVGLPYRLEAFVDVPYTWQQQEILPETGPTMEAYNSGIGDIDAGLNVVLLQESARWPNIIGSISYAEPTAKDLTIGGSPGTPGFIPVSIALSQGRRSGTVGITIVKSTGPAVLFGGFSSGTSTRSACVMWR